MPPSVEAETEPDTNPTLEPTATAALLPTSEGSSSAAGDSLAGTSETGVDPPGEVAAVEFGTAAINILRPGQLSQIDGLTVAHRPGVGDQREGARRGDDGSRYV